MNGKFIDDVYEKSMLYDFYGELLTSNQQEIYEDYFLNDLSLGEIALQRGITRQGVHDMVKRCEKALLGYEDKLHLIERFKNAKDKVSIIEALLINIKNDDTNKFDKDNTIDQIHNLVSDILKDF